MAKFRNSDFFKQNQLHEIFKDGKYVLQGDFPEDKVDDKANKKYQFRLPPQPFQGNPDADIWMLLANPGYAEGISKGLYGNDIAYLDNNIGVREIDDNRELRLKACKAQLRFEKSGKYHNYVLNDEFKGGYSGTKWFLERFVGDTKLLCGEADKKLFESVSNKEQLPEEYWHKIDRRFFLLQIHGYASKSFDESACFPHMEYNKALLRWGIEAGKVIVIARCSSYWQKVIESMDHDDAKIFVMLNNRNSHFTRNNLVRYAEWKQSQLILTIAGSKVEQDLELALGK